MKKIQLHPCGNFNESYDRELTIFSTDFGRIWAIVGIILLLSVPLMPLSPYLIYVMNITGIAAISVIGLNLLTGFTGQISLGHGAFFGVGAYAGAILATRLNLPIFITIPAAGLITAGVGMIFGVPSGRLKGLYLTIATLAGQFIIEYVLVHWEYMTKGTMGITMPMPVFFGFTIQGDIPFYYIIFPLLALMLWIAVNLIRTRFGRAWIAIRDNDRAAEGMGIPIFPYKVFAFAVSSFYAGFAGALWAYYMGSITTEPFNLSLSVEYLAMVIIGGLGSISGSIFGAVFITVLNELLRFMTDSLMNSAIVTQLGLSLAPLREFFYGVAIVLFILFEPRGLAEVWRIVRSNFRLWPFPY
ncbi:MAG: branched-chain amino acid ABC transporter permease [Syntrophobacterales bacterium]|nr:branched-chain amino acid ABC transporter permease [Syntrophobacterales bacterium]